MKVACPRPLLLYGSSLAQFGILVLVPVDGLRPQGKRTSGSGGTPSRDELRGIGPTP